MTSLHFQASFRRSNLLLLCCLFSLYSLAQVKNLNVPGFQWHEPTAWAPPGVPTVNDSVIIDGLTFIMPDSVAYAKFVYVGPIGSLEIERDVANNVPGKLFIVDAPKNAFENNGTIVNGGRINIKNAGANGVINKAYFENMDRAKLEIDSATFVGFKNEALAGIDGFLVNRGSISINNTGSQAISSCDSLHNHAGAIISIVDINFLGDAMFNCSQEAIINEGMIFIENVKGSGFFNAGRCENMDSICVNNVDGIGIRNVGTTADFTNHLGALVKIVNANTSLQNASTFDPNPLAKVLNNGNIILDGSSTLGLENNSKFTISTTGSLTINNATGDRLSLAADALFECLGIISVED